MAGRQHLPRGRRWPSLILPLLALAVLSTLFLLADRGGPPPLPWSEAELGDALAREMRLGAPRYAAVTADGAALVVSAAQVRPAAAGATARKRRGAAAPSRRAGGRPRRRLAGSSTPMAGEVRADRRRHRSDTASMATGSTPKVLTAALDRTRLDRASARFCRQRPAGHACRGRHGADRGARRHADRHVLVFNGVVSGCYTSLRADSWGRQCGASRSRPSAIWAALAP
jgi:lipopolysaccharide export system protein LptC